MGFNDFKHPGHTVTLPAPVGGVIHRQGYIVGSLFVIALDDKAQDELFVGRVVGVHDMTKTNPQVWADGDQVYWDDTLKETTNVGPADAYIGTAEGPALSATASSLVRLNGIGQSAPVTSVDLAEYRSALRIGTGAQELIPHGLGVVPATNGVMVTMQSGHDGAGAVGIQAGQVVEGAHDATNIDITVTLGVEYKVTAQA